MAEKDFGFKDQKEVLDYVGKSSNNVRFVRAIFPDILGRMIDFTIPTSELESAFNEGKGFDGSSVEGMARLEESDRVFMPDPTTFRVFPWQYECKSIGYPWKEAVVFGDILNSDGSPSVTDTRNILQSQMKAAEDRDFILKVGAELEYFLFEKGWKICSFIFTAEPFFVCRRKFLVDYSVVWICKGRQLFRSGKYVFFHKRKPVKSGHN